MRPQQPLALVRQEPTRGDLLRRHGTLRLPRPGGVRDLCGGHDGGAAREVQVREKEEEDDGADRGGDVSEIWTMGRDLMADDGAPTLRWMRNHNGKMARAYMYYRRMEPCHLAEIRVVMCGVVKDRSVGREDSRTSSNTDDANVSWISRARDALTIRLGKVFTKTMYLVRGVPSH
jgi:hypothetical protein